MHKPHFKHRAGLQGTRPLQDLKRTARDVLNECSHFLASPAVALDPPLVMGGRFRPASLPARAPPKLADGPDLAPGGPPPDEAPPLPALLPAPALPALPPPVAVAPAPGSDSNSARLRSEGRGEGALDADADPAAVLMLSGGSVPGPAPAAVPPAVALRNPFASAMARAGEAPPWLPSPAAVLAWMRDAGRELPGGPSPRPPLVPGGGLGPPV